MIHKPISLVKNLSFLLIASNLRAFSVWGMDTSSKVKRDIYVPPSLDEMTADARSWYLKGVANADKDLPSFSELAKKLSDGAPEEEINSLLKGQLRTLLGQAEEANDNTQVLVPRLNSLVENLAYWGTPPISCWSKLKLKATVWFINGKRDNKSYYLQNGAALWCKKRAELLKPISNKLAQKIESDLGTFQDQLLLARDELDDSAQIYVQGIKQLVSMVDDISKHETEIGNVVKTLEESGKKRSGNVKKSSQDSVDIIKAKIDTL